MGNQNLQWPYALSVFGSLQVEADQDDEVQASEMVKALKFTMMRMFKQSGGKTINMMDDSEETPCPTGQWMPPF